MITKIPYKDHEEWLKIRHQYIGGSDAGTIMNMNPYNSPYALWCEKTGTIEGFKGNVITKVGSYLEELVAQMFQEETGKKVQRCNSTQVNDLYPWACANIDRKVVGEDAILEIKTTNNWQVAKKIHKELEYPDSWYCQMMHYMAVTGVKKAYLAVLIECREFKVFELQRDEKEIEALMNAEKAFWDKVINRTPPTPDGAEATTDAISEAYAFSAPNSRVDLFGLDGVFEQRYMLQQTLKQLKEQMDGLDNQIKVAMGSAEKGECGKWNVSWANQSRSTFKKDKALAAGFDPTPFYEQSSSRVFKVSEKRR